MHGRFCTWYFGNRSPRYLVQCFANSNQQWIDLHIRNNGIQGIMYFILISAIATSVGFPRQLIAFMGGYAFGFINGSILSTLGVGIGCIGTLFLSRLIIRPIINRLYPERITKVNQFLSSNPVFKTIIIRLLPIGNNLLTNLVAGVTRVKARHFVIGSLIGYYPQMAIFALMGKGIVVMSTWKIVLSLSLFTVLSLLSMRLYQEYSAVNILKNGRDDEREPTTASN
jgi:uncharacterized membrane protein YdjX (TVP38/TMEM64 family)